MTERHYEPGELVFSEGEDAAFVCRIVAGKAELFRGQGAQQTVVDRLGPGDVTESMAVLEGQRRTAGLRAITDLSIEIIDKQRFLRRVAGDRELAFKLLMYLSDRLHAMQSRAPRPPAGPRADRPPAAGAAPKAPAVPAAPAVARPSAMDAARESRPAPSPAAAAVRGIGPAAPAATLRPAEPVPPLSAPPLPAPAGAPAMRLSGPDGPVAAPLLQPAQADQDAEEAVLEAEERPAAAPADPGPGPGGAGASPGPSAAASPQAAAAQPARSPAPAEARRDPQPPPAPAARHDGGRGERLPWEPTQGKARPNARIRIVPASELMTRVMPLEGIVVDRLPFLVGRRTDKTERQVWVDLAIGDSRPYRLSRAHFSLTMRDGQYILCDLDSAHGTQVNGTPLGRDGSTDFAPLLDGDNLVVAGGRDSPYSFHVVVEPG